MVGWYNMTTTVAIQGERASFHDNAAREFWGADYTPVCCDSFSQVFQAVIARRADYGVVAIENSLYGSINEVYDLLLKHQLWICDEVYSRIEQCLVGTVGATIVGIKEVHSHPIALAQCEAYLASTLAYAERFEHHDTAGSVAAIKQWNDPAKAAIASVAAAELHGMEILAREIETHKQNYTRFVVLHAEKTTDAKSNPKPNKTSLILTVAEKPGALHEALGAFAGQKINLTKLQSRPVIGRAWHYIFYVDVDSGLHEARLQTALRELKAQDCAATILGSYRSSR